MAQALMYSSGPQSKPKADYLLYSYPIGEAAAPVEVEYHTGRVSWTSSAVPSTDRLRVTFTPGNVTAGGVVIPRRPLTRSAVTSEAGGETDGLDWWSFDIETSLITVVHTSAPDVVVTAVRADV